MFSEQYEHIQEIRNRRKADPDTIEDLNNMLEEISTRIFKSGFHFLFEIIQNADDANYQSNNPSLCFKLVKNDPTSSLGSKGAFIIEKNETGFTKEDVKSICRAGVSPKRNSRAFIGEKGIGFKSVFRATDNPHIFSNGYHFCLPANKNDGTIGMVLPYWVDCIPETIDPSLTTIILPLDKTDLSYDDMKENLLQFDPNSILFLNKLKNISVVLDGETIFSLTKEVIDDYYISTIQEISNDGKKNSSIKRFLLCTDSFDKPIEITSEERSNCHESSISIAFPLDDDSTGDGKFFAYLPVKKIPEVPFLLNADFLLISSREDVHVDDPWNKWLISCVPKVFVKAFDKFLDMDEYSKSLYKFIPLNTSDDFFQPAIESIIDALKGMAIILTEPGGKRVKPNEAFLISKDLRSLLFETDLPKSLYTHRVVIEGIQVYNKQLKALGVESYPDEFIQEFFRDVDWIKNHDFNWLLRCYQYFASHKIDVSHCPIIPVDTHDGLQWFSKEEEAIYYPCNEELKSFINDIPDFIHIDLRFLSADFFNEILQETETCRWIEDTLGIQTLNEELINEISLNWVNNHFEGMSDDEIINASLYFSENLGSLLISRNIPIIIFNGEKKLLSMVKSQPGLQAIVPPMKLDTEAGWQNIFTTYEERDNLEILSDYYVTFAKTNDTSDSITHFFQNIGVNFYPLPLMVTLSLEKDQLVPLGYDYEAECAEKVRSTRGKKIINWKPFEMLKYFTFLNNDQKEIFTKSLLIWLKNQKPATTSSFVQKYPWQELIIYYFYYSCIPKPFNSELLQELKKKSWLPTTKGFYRPNDVFIQSAGIIEIFEYSVPYYEGQISDNLQKVFKLLGVRTEITSVDLVDYLSSLSTRSDISIEVIEKIYRRLSSIPSFPPDLKKRFESEKLFFIPLNDTNGKWVSKDQVIWRDRSQVFEDDYNYLQKYYPKFKDFFVNILEVKSDVDSECFANRLLRLQEEMISQSQDYPELLPKIYNELQKISNLAIRPSWWNDFQRKVKIWTTNSTFETPDLVYIPDDGDLKEIFEGPEIHFVWYPSDKARSYWDLLYKSLEVKNISEVVKRSIVRKNVLGPCSKPHYLTPSAKILILAWLFEKYYDEIYKKLVDNKAVELLLETQEFEISDLEIQYQLKSNKITKQHSAYWDLKSKTLLILNQPDKHIKPGVSRAIARELIILGEIENKTAGDLTEFIELVLNEDKNYCIQKLSANNWRCPDEVKDWLREKDLISGEHETTLIPIEYFEKETIIESSDNKILSSQVNSKDYTEDLSQNVDEAISERSSQSFEDEEGEEIVELPTKSSPNPERRYELVKNKSKNAPEKEKETRERSVSVNLPPVKEEAKPYLLDHYTNIDGDMICQICKSKLPFKLDDNQYYFETVQFLGDLKKHHKENYLALCPNHSAMFRHANQSKMQLKDLFLNMKGCRLEVTLARKQKSIHFTEVHISDLRAIIDSEEMGDDK
ncbi:hypothetical protein FTO68_00455 [Methanocalculus taiwanensis]|uniref:Sacsin/Nov domain-containing protein n=1 Tax=Methanocalculus taiwanensis TaxID=106207 RepID=A0ABD4TGQ0_9EURY|nr:hypothetical protein [Methanocalculus taiwanensis]MCQ1537467.1 hypothetical protein [Methanocalculus taiwanensis]